MNEFMIHNLFQSESIYNVRFKSWLRATVRDISSLSIYKEAGIRETETSIALQVFWTASDTGAIARQQLQYIKSKKGWTKCNAQR